MCFGTETLYEANYGFFKYIIVIIALSTSFSHRNYYFNEVDFTIRFSADHFTVLWIVTKPFYESEVRDRDAKLVIKITESFTYEKQQGLYHNKVNCTKALQLSAQP